MTIIKEKGDDLEGSPNRKPLDNGQQDETSTLMLGRKPFRILA